MSTRTFPAQVAGTFYSNNPLELRSNIETMLSQAKTNILPIDGDITGLLVPHAGHVYSGLVAAHGFATVLNRPYSTVVILALSHRSLFSKVALLDSNAYETPLGLLPLNLHEISKLISEHGDCFSINETAFKEEHSLEVLLPFIQTSLPDANIIPMIVAIDDSDQIKKTADKLFSEYGGRSDLLFLISSDLSHFFSSDKAKLYNEKSLSLLENWDLENWLSHASNAQKGMCGVRPMFTFASYFDNYPKKERAIVRLKLADSSEISGNKTSVVGYGSMAFVLKKGIRKNECR